MIISPEIDVHSKHDLFSGFPHNSVRGDVTGLREKQLLRVNDFGIHITIGLSPKLSRKGWVYRS